jgi:hypothetical protein
MVKRKLNPAVSLLLVAIICSFFTGSAFAQRKATDKLRDDDRLTKDDKDQDNNKDDNDDNDGKGKNSRTFGPFRSTSPDGGSCGTSWAVDMFDRFFIVTNNGNGTFRVREEFRHGVFTTTGPISPGRCDNTNTPHGSIVNPGVVGRFTGYLDGTVTSTTYNPNGCNATGAVCTTTTGFLAATFGPSGATYTCSNGYAGCKFDFNYFAQDQGLLYHHWEDRGTDGFTEQFFGDIANL